MTLRNVLALCVAFTFPADLIAQPIHPNLNGNQLAAKIREEFSPVSPTTNYSAARKSLFGAVDRNASGQVRLIYTPEFVPGLPPSSPIPPVSVANTEHTWPQSKFKNASKKNQIKCDLHHLFPCRESVNSARSSHPFGDIADDETQKWFNSPAGQQIPPPPPTVRDQYSEFKKNDGAGVFEPREDDKGDIARAMFYVLVVYGDQAIDKQWFGPQLDTLLAWHHVDPADSTEALRSGRVKATQGNDNPFILDRTLIYRIVGRPIPPQGTPPVVVTPSPSPTPPSATGLKVVTWNAHEIFSLNSVEDRADDFKAFAADLKPDVVMLQEVTSFEQVVKLREVMQLTGFDIAVSNFAPDDDQEHGSLEVAILSRFPLENVTEFDPTPDNDSNLAEMPEDEKPVVVPSIPGVAPFASTARGFLMARVPSRKLTLWVTHLKSSQGASGKQDALKNTPKREVVAAALADCVVQESVNFPDSTSIVVGDFNIGETDAKKIGTELLKGEYTVAGRSDDDDDGYDETHALLAGGLVRGLKMRSLTKTLGKATYRGFPDATGPIDCIYVHGPLEGKFEKGVRSAKRYGSEHHPVSATLRP